MVPQVKGFLETSLLDWPGKLTAVLFLPGCNFRCPYCHNHPLVIHPEGFESIRLDHILRRLKGLKGWVDGVCVTGGEPTLNPNLPLLLERIKAEGWATKVDTNGAFPDRIRELTERNLVDCVAMDIKAPLDSRPYSQCAGVPVDISAIRQSVAILTHGGIDYTFRMTVVPTLLTEEQIYEAALQLVGGSPYPAREVMGMFWGGNSGVVLPLVALILGILILVMPRLLNVFVALYLIFSGILGLIAQIK